MAKLNLNAEGFDISTTLARGIKKKKKARTMHYQKCELRSNLAKKKTSRMVHTLFFPGTITSYPGKIF